MCPIRACCPRPAELEADLRQLGGLARAGLARDDDDLVVADGGRDVVTPLADRQLGRIGDREGLRGLGHNGRHCARGPKRARGGLRPRVSRRGRRRPGPGCRAAAGRARRPAGTAGRREPGRSAHDRPKPPRSPSSPPALTAPEGRAADAAEDHRRQRDAGHRPHPEHPVAEARRRGVAGQPAAVPYGGGPGWHGGCGWVGRSRRPAGPAGGTVPGRPPAAGPSGLSLMSPTSAAQPVRTLCATHSDPEHRRVGTSSPGRRSQEGHRNLTAEGKRPRNGGAHGRTDPPRRQPPARARRRRRGQHRRADLDGAALRGLGGRHGPHRQQGGHARPRTFRPTPSCST